MSTVIAKLKIGNESTLSASLVAATSGRSETALGVLQDSLQDADTQTLSDVMTAIREDCSKNSLRYVLRSDTGQDGE